jgi:hypothetical protein
MSKLLNDRFAALLVGAACSAVSVAAPAQTITGTPSIALKNGESVELTDAYYISTLCRSLLTGTPEVEVLDGPPGVSVTIKEAMITPRTYGCAKPVAGGKVVISARDIDEPSYSTMTVRIKYKTREGERVRSQVYKISLFP